MSGQKLSLSSYRGKVVLLDFWATWCEPCREEIPRFVALQGKYGDRGLEILGISMDDEEPPVRDFYRQFQINYPVLMGDAKTGEAYGGVLGLPVVFVIDREGRIRSKRAGSVKVEALEKELQPLLSDTGTP